MPLQRSPVAVPTPGATPSRTASERTRLLVALLCAALAAPALAEPLRLPGVVDPESSEHHVGKVIFLQLVTPDLDGAKRFYAGLLGWTFRDFLAGSVPYSEAMLDGQPVAGLIRRDLPLGGKRRPSWLTFFAVRDVDATRAIALGRGAKVVLEPRTIPGRGRQAVFADPQGAVFAILASAAGDPPDVLVDPGEWIWSTLLTTDPDADAAFYQALFDYEVFDLSGPEGAQHLVLGSDDHARASANSLPAGEPSLAPHWLNFVRVEDVAAATAQAEKLGGRVLLGPRPDRHGGRIAVVSDPQGAPFGLLEWPGAGNGEVSR